MKALLKTLICTGLCLLPLSSAHGGFGFYANSGSFILLDFGSGNQYFHLGPSSAGDPAFQGARLNASNIEDGGPIPFRVGFDRLTLNGFQNYTFENTGDNVLGGNLSYRVYRVGATPGAFSTISWNSFASLGGGNERHQNINANIDILGAIPESGEYILEAFAWAEADYGDGGPLDDIVWAGPSGNIFQSAGGSAPIGVFQASFAVERLPEPSTVGLLGVGVALLRVVRNKKPLQVEE